jgi:hypothetical protein
MLERAGDRPQPVSAGPPAAVPASERPRGLLATGALVLAVVSVLSFGAVGRSFYEDFRLPQGYGMYHLLSQELAFYSMFFVFGGIAVAALWLALRTTAFPAALVDLVRRLAAAGWPLALGLCVAVGAVSTLIRADILRDAAVSDDEHVYQFIAQTLRRGSLTAPSPGGDLAFFQEQFVVLRRDARFGKYPIGHPLVLAAGQALGMERLVVPLLTAGMGAVVYAIGRMLGGASTALVAMLLFATSPHVLLTGATLFSQPTAALCLCAAVACLLAGERPGARTMPWLAGAGIALGFGILVRPLPGVLFVPVAALYAMGRPPYAVPTVVRRLLTLGLPLAVAAGIMLFVNRAQVGHPLVTAYGESLAAGQGPQGILVTTSATFAMRAMSLAGSLIRLNFWLFGWPVSLLLCLLATRSRSTALLWGMVGASLAYRLLTPKVGVGSVGPIYFFEVTPLLCLLSAEGALRTVRSFPRAPLTAGSLAALIVSATIVSGTLFLPSRLTDLRRMGAAQNLVDDMIREKGIGRALVFHESVVPWWTHASWAYFPRINSPAMDDEILFVLLQRATLLEENVDFWKRRFPERSAWYFGYLDGRPILVPLERFVQDAARGAMATPGGSAPAPR